MKPRVMSLTPELVALSMRPEIDYGIDARRTPLDDAGFRAFAERLHGENPEGPLWVFAYGSLIWKPDFVSVEHRRGTVFGWHRSFSLELRNWRGSPEIPGLMMALQRGGRCDGMVYRLPEEDPVPQIERMLRREVGSREDLRTIRWINVRTEDGPVRALVFWVGPRGEGTAVGLPPREIAAVLARACGYIGSCAEYLYNTVRHLEEFGIRDRNLWRLQQLVAEELRKLHGV